MRLSTRISRGLWGFALIALTFGAGCASMPTIQMPWNKSAGAEDSEETGAANETEAAGDGHEKRAQAVGKADTRQRKVRTASYWAGRAVDASRRRAFAAGMEATARSEPEALSSSQSNGSSPYGAWELPTATRHAANRGSGASDASVPHRPAPTPKTRSVERNADGAEESKQAEADSNETSSEQSTTSTTGRAAPREPTESTPDAGSHGWPVGVPNAGASAKRGPRTLIDPTTDASIYQLDDSDDRSKVTEEWGLNAPSKKGAVAIPGTYVRNLGDYDEFEDLEPEEREEQIAVVVPGEEVTVYAGETEVATLEFPGSSDLPDELADVRPVQVVRDGTTQLLVFWNESPEEKKVVEHRVALLKTIGPFVGTIFERTVATSASPGAKLQRAGYLEFLRGADHAFIQWTPAGPDGEPAIDSSNVLKWNEWEGVFRVPKPPPTAPDQRS